MESKSTTQKLQELFELYQSGALTKEEFDSLKSEAIHRDSDNVINKVEVPLIEKKDDASNSTRNNRANNKTKNNSKRILNYLLIFIGVSIIISAIIILIPKNNDIDAELESLTKNVNNSYEAAKIIEKHQMNEYSQLVNRKDDKLVLKIDNGNDIILKDQPNEGETVLFTFRNFYQDINSYLIAVHYYEGGIYSIYNKTTGEKIDVPGIIKISPDNSRILSFRVGYEEENLIEIYNYSSNSYRNEFKFEPKEWSPTNAKWIDNNHIEIEKSEIRNESNKIGKVIYEYDGFWKEQKNN